MGASFEPLFSIDRPSLCLLSSKLKPPTLKYTIGSHEDGLCLQVAKDSPGQFTDRWILAARERTQEPPLLPGQILLELFGSSSLAAASNSHAKTNKPDMIFADGPGLRTTLINLTHSLIKRIGYGTSAGNTALVVGAWGNDHVDRQAPPEVVKGKTARLDISTPEVVDVALGELWAFRGENAAETEEQEPGSPMKGGNDPKQGQRPKKTPSAAKAVDAISETKQK